MLNKIFEVAFQQSPAYIFGAVVCVFYYSLQKEIKNTIQETQKTFAKTLDDNTKIIRDLTMIISRLEGVLIALSERRQSDRG